MHSASKEYKNHNKVIFSRLTILSFFPQNNVDMLLDWAYHNKCVYILSLHFGPGGTNSLWLEGAGGSVV